MRLAVVGSGAGGLAISAWSAVHGHEVHVLTRRGGGSGIFGRSAEIRVTGIVDVAARVASFGADIADVLPMVELIVVIVTADAHPSVMRHLSPHLGADQTVLLCPGRTGGALVAAKEIDARGRAGPSIWESQTLPFACRTRSERSVEIIAAKSRVGVAGIPPRAGERDLRRIQALHPSLQPATSILETGLHNIGAVLHPAGLLAQTRRFGRPYYFYSDMPAQAIALIKGIDEERGDLCEALGVTRVTVADWIKATYPDTIGAELEELMDACPAYGDILGPQSIDHRYLTEDVPTGLVPMSALARVAGVPVPLIDMTIQRASAAIGRDFGAGGRGLEQMGVDAATVPAIRGAAGVKN